MRRDHLSKSAQDSCQICTHNSRLLCTIWFTNNCTHFGLLYCANTVNFKFVYIIVACKTTNVSCQDEYIGLLKCPSRKVTYIYIFFVVVVVWLVNYSTYKANTSIHTKHGWYKQDVVDDLSYTPVTSWVSRGGSICRMCWLNVGSTNAWWHFVGNTRVYKHY